MTENMILAIDRVEQKFERLRECLALAEAERDAAQAGEARAVEALKALTCAALRRNYWFDTCSRTLAPDWEEKADAAIASMDAAMKQVAGIAIQPALVWLAQQRREAAAEVVNALADGCERAKRPILAQELRGHVAALLAGAEALDRLEAMESTSSTMLPKSASASEEQ